MYKPFGCLDFYSVLGVDRDASVEEIKEAFRQLALRYHPDKSRSRATEEKFKIILHAYNVLTDEYQRYNHDNDLRRRQDRNFNRTHPRQEETDHRQEPSLSQRFWRWLIPDCIFVVFSQLRLWLTTYCQLGFIFAKSGYRKCCQRATVLLIKLGPKVKECAVGLGGTAAVLVKWSLCAFIKLFWWNIKQLMAELFWAFVRAPGSPIQKLIFVGFAWQIAILGHDMGAWPWVGWLMLMIIHFSLIFVMFGVKSIIFILLNTIPSPSLL
ncbi:uncharacterized protein [Drosophila kikkawai]|uniref:J domain-containing protein n=1 Tax=Drosophila kikkawai TaxID=30033 RepID=A0A6P4J795_DROKI|nr:uncharacterized protein LOC108080662 [Drosophila kikkawai]